MSTKSNSNGASEEEKKQIEKYKRQKEVERARKARSRDRKSSASRIVTTNFNDVVPESQAKAAAQAMKHHLPPPPSITTNMTGADARTLKPLTSTPKEKEIISSELAELREKKLTNKFHKQFTTVIDSISKERAVAEAALAEFERKKAENAAYYAARGEAPPAATLTTMEKISVELRRRNEIIRKKEAHTKELYHRYDKVKRVDAQGEAFEFNEGELPPLPEEIVRQMDLLSEQEKLVHNKSQRKTQVTETLRQYETPPAPPLTDNMPTKRRNNKIPRGNWAPTSLHQAIAEEENHKDKNNSTDGENELFENQREKAEAADQDAVLEESELQASLAETNARQLKKAMSWLNNNGMMTSSPTSPIPTSKQKLSAETPPGSMSFDNISEIGGSEMGDDDDSFMAQSLAAFLIQEAGQNIDEDDEDMSCTSQSFHDDRSAVLAAEKAARDMADAVSHTSSITADTALKSTKKPPKEEKWYAYWSKEHQREYYYEPNSQKVTWTSPDSYSVTSSFRADTTIGTDMNSVRSNRNKSPARNKNLSDNVSVTSSHNSLPSINTMTSDTRSTTNWPSRDYTPSVGDSSTTMTRSKTLRLRTIALRKSRKKRMIRRMLWSTATTLVVATSSGYYAYQNDMLSKDHQQYVDIIFEPYHDTFQKVQIQILSTIDTYYPGNTIITIAEPTKPTETKTKNKIKIKSKPIPKVEIPPIVPKTIKPKPIPKTKIPPIVPKKEQKKPPPPPQAQQPQHTKVPAKQKKIDHTKTYVSETEISTTATAIPFLSEMFHFSHNNDEIQNVNTVTTKEKQKTSSQEIITIQKENIKKSNSKKAIATKEEKEAQLALQREKEVRPKLCFIPLAYIVSRHCRVLASEKPVFNLQDFVNSMMQ